MKASLLVLFLGAMAFAEDIPGQGEPESDSTPAPQSNNRGPGSTGVTYADEKAAEPDWKVHWEFQAITLPGKRGRVLLQELRDEKTFAAGWTKLQTMIAKDEAEVTLDTGAQTIGSWHAKFSQGEEVRYPVDYQVPKIIEAEKTEKAKEAVTVATGAVPAGGAPVSVTFGPTSFEKQKVGIALSLSAEVSTDGKRLRLETETDHTWLTQWDEFEAGRLANNEKMMVKQPRFSNVHYEGTCGLFSGERALLGAHPVPGAEGKMELFFLRVWTTIRKEAGQK